MSLLSWVLDIICTFIEAFCMYHYAEIMFEHRVHNSFFERCKWAFWGIPVFIYVLIVFVLNRIILTSPYTVLLLLLHSVLSIWIFWKCDFLNAVAVAGGYLWALSVSGTVEISITGFIGGEELIRKTTAEQGGIRAIYLCLLGTYWLTINILVAKWLKKRKILLSETKHLAIVSLIGIIGFVFIAEQMLLSFNIIITAMDYCFLFAVSICYSVSYYKLKNNQLKQRLEMIDAQNDILMKNYQQVSDIYTMNARLYHDMNHHLKMIYNMAKNEKDIKLYIESLTNSTTDANIKSLTGIDVLDTILNEMEKKAESKGVLLNIETQVLPQDIGIEKKDICALFANLLENSIEAASKEINVVIKYINRMLIVRIANDYLIKPIIRNGHMQTTKKDKLNHGWGTQSIEHVVNKYNGDIEYKLLQDKFYVDIMINLAL